MHSSAGRSTGVNVGKSSSSNLNGNDMNGGGGGGGMSSMPSPSATILDTLKKKMNMLKDELEVSKDELERTRQQLEEEKRRRECVSLMLKRSKHLEHVDRFSFLASLTTLLTSASQMTRRPLSCFELVQLTLTSLFVHIG